MMMCNMTLGYLMMCNCQVELCIVDLLYGVHAFIVSPI